MQDETREQVEKSTSDTGKFDTAEDLLAAYNALEREFTKRCQLVKQLQTELDAYAAQEQAKPDEVAAAPETPQDVSSAVTADSVLNEIASNAAEYAERLCAVPEIMDACIASYKQRLLQSRAVGSPSGMAVIIPAKRPSTLADAKRLADALLSGN